MKNTKKIYLLVILLMVFCLIKIFVINKRFVSISNISLIIFWILLCFLSLILLKYPKDNALYKKNANKMVVISLLFTILITYLLGFFVGFGRNGLVTSFTGVIKTIFPIILIVGSKEVIRYIVAKNSLYKKLPIIILTVCYIVFEILISFKPLINMEHAFYYVSTYVLPLICYEMLCSYLSYNFGIETTLIYALSYSLYNYLIPILPDLGDYVKSVIFIMLPFMIYMLTIKIVRYQNKEKISLKQNVKGLFLTPVIVFLIVIVCLVSGLFRYKLVAIASDSMNPVFYRGDGVIYKKISYIDKIEIGDVVAFMNSGNIITHRVTGIVKSSDGIIYKTKGDSNNSADDFDVKDRDVIGVIKYVVKYVGYPTVWFNEGFKRIRR